MNKAYSGVGNPVHEFLGAGAVYFNWGLANETLAGVTKGGNAFNDNAEFREREADGDFFPVKGHKDIIKMTPQLTLNAVKLSTQNLKRFLAGVKADTTTTPGTAILTRTLDLSASYIENVAFVGANREGKLMVVLLKNVLGDGVFNLPTTVKSEEIVPAMQFTAHADSTFDPDDQTTYPYQIYKDISTVTFTIEDDDIPSPIEGAEVVFDEEYGITIADGTVAFVTDKGSALRYTIISSGFDTQSGTVDVTEETTAVSITMITTA